MTTLATSGDPRFRGRGFGGVVAVATPRRRRQMRWGENSIRGPLALNSQQAFDLLAGFAAQDIDGCVVQRFIMDWDQFNTGVAGGVPGITHAAVYVIERDALAAGAFPDLATAEGGDYLYRGIHTSITNVAALEIRTTHRHVDVGSRRRVPSDRHTVVLQLDNQVQATSIEIYARILIARP